MISSTSNNTVSSSLKCLQKKQVIAKKREGARPLHPPLNLSLEGVLILLLFLECIIL